MDDSTLRDANGLRFWQLADAAAWPDRRHAVFDEVAACGAPTLHLASERTLRPALPGAEAFTAAQVALDAVPRAVDALESVARWDAAIASVVVRSALPDDTLLLSLAETPTDMAVAADGVLLIALPGGVLLHDLRSRWADVTVSLAGFTPWRLAPVADGGAWVLERTSGRIARLLGRPLRALTPSPDMVGPQTFRPCPENGNPPRLELAAEPVYGASERVVALATGPEMPGQLLLLCWLDGDGSAAVRRMSAATASPGAPEPLAGAAYAYTLAALSADRFAVRVPGRRDAPAFWLPAAAGSEPLPPLGDVYPLAPDAREATFAGGWRDAGRPPHYPVGDGAAAPLHALSYVSLARSGEARNWSGSGPTWRALLVDSGDTTTVWHRLHAEAAIPPNCGFVVWLAATNEPRLRRRGRGAGRRCECTARAACGLGARRQRRAGPPRAARRRPCAGPARSVRRARAGQPPARAPAHRPLVVAARGAARRRTQRPRHRRAARLGQPLRLRRKIPAACLPRDRVRRARTRAGRRVGPHRDRTRPGTGCRRCAERHAARAPAAGRRVARTGGDAAGRTGRPGLAAGRRLSCLAPSP
jgi:hypothetical protein